MAGLGGKYVKTDAAGTSEELALVKLEEVISKLNAALKKLDLDATVTGTDYYSLHGVKVSVAESLIPSPVKQGV